MTRIEWVIDELVLVGFDPRERHRIADAVERGLASNASIDTLAPLGRSGADVTALRAPDVRPPRGAGSVKAESIGAGIARSIHAAVAAPGMAPR